jgi:hypothetical protein
MQLPLFIKQRIGRWFITSQSELPQRESPSSVCEEIAPPRGALGKQRKRMEKKQENTKNEVAREGD